MSDLPPSLIEFSRLQKNVLCGKVAEASLKKIAAEAVSRMRLMAKFILCLMIEVGQFFATSINYYQWILAEFLTVFVGNKGKASIGPVCQCVTDWSFMNFLILRNTYCV